MTNLVGTKIISIRDYRRLYLNLNKQELDYIAQKIEEGISNRQIAKDLWGRDSFESRIRRAKSEGLLDIGDAIEHKAPKVLFFDVEVSASIVAAFSMFKHFSTPDHVIQMPYMLTFACEWMDKPNDIHGYKLDDYPLFDSNPRDDFELIKQLWDYLDAADWVIAHNINFDQGWFAQRCVVHGLPQPSPYKLICTLKACKKAFSLPSNSLDYTTKYFGVEFNKFKHDGISLWIRCWQGDRNAMSEMLSYNIGDIPTLRELYYKIRPYIPNHPNFGLYGDMKEVSCVCCGSKDLTYLSTPATTSISVFNSVRCESCGKVQRVGKSSTDAHSRGKLLRNIY